MSWYSLDHWIPRNFTDVAGPGSSFVFSLTLWSPTCWVPLVHLSDQHAVIRVMGQCDVLPDVQMVPIPVDSHENAKCVLSVSYECVLFLILFLDWDRRESTYQIN